MPIPSKCSGPASAVEGLKRARASLQEQLQPAAPSEKLHIVQEIRQLTREIADAEDALFDCIASTPPDPPPPPPLAAVFTGGATITTSHPSAMTPFRTAVTLELLFDGRRTTIVIVSFPPITTPPFDTPFGRSTTTVSKIGGGAGAYWSGNMLVPLTLRFDHSIEVPLPFFEEDSDLQVSLSTSAPGTPVDASGAVILAGTGTFDGGVLGGHTGTLVVVGAINPFP